MKAALIVDRDAETRLAARRILEGAGFAVSTAAESSNQPGGRFDLVIADPASVSAAALRRKHPKTRVLTLSGTASAGLSKPFTASQLLAAVRRCLARPVGR